MCWLTRLMTTTYINFASLTCNCNTVHSKVISFLAMTPTSGVIRMHLQYHTGNTSVSLEWNSEIGQSVIFFLTPSRGKGRWLEGCPSFARQELSSWSRPGWQPQCGWFPCRSSRSSYRRSPLPGHQSSSSLKRRGLCRDEVIALWQGGGFIQHHVQVVPPHQ